MKKNKIFKFLKISIITMVLFVLILPLFNNLEATPGTTITDIKKIDKARYPGVVERVERLKAKYPSWEFEFYRTGLDWNRFIGIEYSPERTTSPFNLVPKSSTGGWVCEYRGTRLYDSERWIAASYHAIEYAADPRNYINESNIFSLKTTEGRNSLSKTNSINLIRSELKGASYVSQAEVIYNVSYNENVDFIDVISKLWTEQGTGSVLTDGSEGTDGIKYYNPFNVGATGLGDGNVVANGTKWAQARGWDTFEKGLKGGIHLIKSEYAKQNSAYYEKFNSTEIDYSGIGHQYMQDLFAPLKDGVNKRDAYKVHDPNLTGKYTFIIPLYENMQKVATEVPNSSLPTPKGKTYTQPVVPNFPAEATMKQDERNIRRGEGSIHAPIITEISINSPIRVREKAPNKDGYEWYLIYYNFENGKFQNTGYIARNEVGSKNYTFEYIYNQKPTMQGKTKDYWPTNNQESTKYPVRAMISDDGVNVRKSPTNVGSSAILETLTIGTHFEVIGKEKDANGYSWYKIKYDLNTAGTAFTKTGYMARNAVGSKDYWFLFLEEIGSSSSSGGSSSSGDSSSSGSTTSKDVAKTTTSLNVRKGSASLSGKIANTIPSGSQIKIRQKMPNKDGYEWYLIYYNPVNGKYQNTGYVARNAVGSKTYYFNYISTPSTGGNSSSGGSSSSGSTTSKDVAKTTTSLNVRKGSASLSGKIANTIPSGSQIKIRQKMPNKDGYEWYLIYYNPVNGKYQNTGYVARNAVGSKSYYFNYI